jgi:NAD+-dependent protein deacetylase sirtuin 4
MTPVFEVDPVPLLADKRLVVLTGAGCSTESGIPAYRGVGAPAQVRTPMQHGDFVRRAEARRRYWARSFLGWPRIAEARPNPAHEALAQLEDAEVMTGLITQNVDGLHHAAGSRNVIELHGRLARVRCLDCGLRLSRDLVQERMLALNDAWAGTATASRMTPDGDADLPDELVGRFVVPVCDCGGVLMPDVVFFGGSVDRDTLAAAWAAFDRAEVLLVVGSSLTVFSGYRFVRRAAEVGKPVVILNRGETRGDPEATLRLDVRAAEALPVLAAALKGDTR